MTKRIALYALGAIAAALLIAQLVRPAQTNPPVTGDVGAPPAVATALRAACYDCHSNETRWPWYSQVAPVSWLVTRDVNEGRRELNFSTWTSYSPQKQGKKLRKIGKEVTEGEMPMAIYLPLHPEAKLSAEAKKALLDWAGAGAAAAAGPAEAVRDERQEREGRERDD